MRLVFGQLWLRERRSGSSSALGQTYIKPGHKMRLQLGLTLPYSPEPKWLRSLCSGNPGCRVRRCLRKGVLSKTDQWRDKAIYFQWPVLRSVLSGFPLRIQCCSCWQAWAWFFTKLVLDAFGPLSSDAYEGIDTFRLRGKPQ